MKRFIFLFFVILLWGGPAFGKVYLTKEEALKKAFPEAEKIRRMTSYLTRKEIAQIERLSGKKVESRLFIYYRAEKEKKILGFSVFVSHTVKTKPAVYMLVMAPDYTVRAIEMLAFYEPEEFLPPKKWLDRFTGMKPDGKFPENKRVDAISSATFTAASLTGEINRTLAIFLKVILKK